MGLFGKISVTTKFTFQFDNEGKIWNEVRTLWSARHFHHGVWGFDAAHQMSAPLPCLGDGRANLLQGSHRQNSFP